MSTLAIDTIFPSLSEDPVLSLVFKGKNCLDPWFPRKADTGEPHEHEVKQLFEEWRRTLVGQSHPRLKKEDLSPPLFSIMIEVAPSSSGADHASVKSVGSTSLYGGPDRRLDPLAFLKGPLWAGETVKVHDGAQLIGPSLIGSSTRIGSSAIIKRSIIGAKCRIDGHAHVNDSIIGSCVYIGPGAKLLNTLDPFNESGSIDIPDRRSNGENGHGKAVHWLRRGSIVGDDCVIGADAVLMPGVILLPGCRVPIRAVIEPGIYDFSGLLSRYPLREEKR